MRARSAVLLALALLSAACAHPPRWVRRTPGLRMIYRPYALPYLENPKFSFEIKRDWKGPENLEGGVRFRAPRGTARISVTYHLEGSAGWKDMKAWRQWMRQQGTTEDSHVVDEIEVSSRAAVHCIYSTVEYDPQYLLGVKSQVNSTELAVLPDDQGVFIVRYEGERGDFRARRKVFLRFLESLTLAFVDPPPVE